MGLLDFLKTGNIVDSDKIYESFGVEPLIDENDKEYLQLWKDVYFNNAPWLDGVVTLDDMLNGSNKQLRTLGMAKSVCEELARLTTLGCEIDIVGGKRAKALKEIIYKNKFKLHKGVEIGTALGCIVFKPTTAYGGLDIITLFDMVPIRVDNEGNIVECIFIDKIETKKDIYIRAEHHNFTEEKYEIKNKCFISHGKSDKLHEIQLNIVPEWSDIKEEVILKGYEKPLFTTFKTTKANNIDIHSKIGMSVFSGCIDQLEDLDVAYTRFAYEIFNSNKIIFTSQYALDQYNGKTRQERGRTKLPDFIKGLELGVNAENTIYEHNPVLQVQQRKDAINLLLSFIGYKCGFSNGYFQFSDKTGLVTATQIEAEQQQTINTVSNIRQEYQKVIDELIYSYNVLMDIYEGVQKEEFEINYYFKDITSNFEEDRARSLQLVKENILPKWKYLTEYEGYTEEEAKQLVEEANKDGGSERQDDYGNQIEQLQKQYVEGNKRVSEETEEPDKGIKER